MTTNEFQDSPREPGIPELRQLGSEFARVAEADSSKGRRKPRRAAVAAVIAIVAVPVGYATAQGVIGDGGDSPPGVPASECPEANAAWKKHGLGPPDTYAPSCPTPEQIDSMMRGATVQPPPEVAERMKEHGWDPAQVLEEQRQHYNAD